MNDTGLVTKAVVVRVPQYIFLGPVDQVRNSYRLLLSLISNLRKRILAVVSSSGAFKLKRVRPLMGSFRIMFSLDFVGGQLHYGRRAYLIHSVCEVDLAVMN